MGISRKRQLPDTPPLIEEVKAGEPIILDKQEQDVIDSEIEIRFPELKDRLFPQNVVDTALTTIVTVVGQEALHRLARMKLFRDDLKGAASTCMKSLGLFGGQDSDWLLLAEIFAEHGDIVRARGFLDIAKKAHKKNKNIHEKNFEPVWKNNVQRVQDIIISKQPK